MPVTVHLPLVFLPATPLHCGDEGWMDGWNQPLLLLVFADPPSLSPLRNDLIGRPPLSLRTYMSPVNFSQPLNLGNKFKNFND